MSFARLHRTDWGDAGPTVVLVNLATVAAVVPRETGSSLIWFTSGDGPRVQWNVTESVEQILIESFDEVSR